MNLESKVVTQLNILRSTVRQVILKKATQTRESFQNLVKKYSASGQYDKAFGSLNGFCCQYEQERATLYLLECIEVILKNIKLLLSSKSCPGEFDTECSILCFSRTILHIPQLDMVVDDCFSKVWGKPAVENMKYSEKVPDSMKHLNPRSSFTLEEIHMFVHKFERDLNVMLDFNWFYEKYPINSENDPEQISHVQVLGKTVSLKQVEQPPRLIPQKSRETFGRELPALPPFKKDSYLKLVNFVDNSLTKWNTWKFVI